MRIATSMLYDRGMTAITDQQSAVSATQMELSTGLRVNKPSDDPVAAAGIVTTNSALSRLDSSKSAQSDAQTSLSMTDSALQTAQNLLQGARTTLVQANNSALSSSDRASLAQSLQGTLDQLVSAANSQDGNGQYLFGGYASQTAPFANAASGVSYQGDDGQRSLQVTSNQKIAVSLNGNDVFMRIKSGNGVFTTSASSSNTGSGSIDAGTVTQAQALTGHSYQITFASSTAGTTYSVMDTTTNQPVQAPAASNTYQAGSAITVGGQQFTISGTPANGDTFSVSPSTNQSAFTTLSNAISALKSGSSTAAQAAQLQTSITGSLASLDQALSQTLSARTAVGLRENQLTQLTSQTTSDTTTDTAKLSTLQDVDYASAVSALSKEQTGLQAAEQSYVKIVNNSLFNYL